MSERYSRLFTLPENLYAVGSPVVIAAGTLLKDNQTGKIVAQLKLRSISSEIIKAVKVNLSLFDTAGNPIGNVVEYEYLDLDVSRDTEFGQKNPVFVAESKARSYKVAVTEVVFLDRSVWTTNIEAWEPLSRPVPLKINDPELLKQYQLRFGYRSIYEPKEEKDLWYCTCGELNHIGEGCHCGNSLFELQTVDMVALEREKNERLSEEAQQAAAEKAAAEIQRQKNKKTLSIVMAAVCAVVALMLLVAKVIVPNNEYNAAVALMEAGQYNEAIAAFEAMEGYKDSTTQIEECKYMSAVSLIEAGQYQEAIAAFKAMEGYRDSEERVDSIYREYIRSVVVGDYIFFGTYEQDNNSSNGKEDVEWLVLDRQEDKIFVISRYALDCQPYNTELTDATWATCSLRKWLNSEFINNAFTAEEQAMIAEASISADKNPQTTQDRVFLLSNEEAARYFTTDEARKCATTEYANAQGAYTSWKHSADGKAACWWWTRSPLSSDYQDIAYGINAAGSTNSINPVNHNAGAIRPVLWISLEP